MLPEGSSLSNWEKPGGKTGMVVLGLLGAGGLMLFYKALPFLITLASNTLYLGLLLGLITGIINITMDCVNAVVLRFAEFTKPAKKIILFLLTVFIVAMIVLTILFFLRKYGIIQ